MPWWQRAKTQIESTEASASVRANCSASKSAPISPIRGEVWKSRWMCRHGKIWPTAGALYIRSRAACLDRRDRLDQEAVMLVARAAAGHADLFVGARLDRRPRLDRV